MAKLDPQVDFEHLDDDGIAKIGLDAAEILFARNVAAGLTNNDSLAIAIGFINDEGQPVLAIRHFGNEEDAAKFEVNIDSETGKLATVLNHRMSTVDAFAELGDEIPDGPQRWPGGGYRKARVRTAAGWKVRYFVGAASGVQGGLDHATVDTGLAHSAFAWGEQMIAIFGKPE